MCKHEPKSVNYAPSLMQKQETLPRDFQKYVFRRTRISKFESCLPETYVGFIYHFNLNVIIFSPECFHLISNYIFSMINYTPFWVIPSLC